MKTFQMIVNKKDEKTKKYVPQGEVTVTVPVLEDIIPFMAAKITGEEEGVPLYDSPEANFVMGALMAYVKAAARNKLESGTANVKEGLTIPTNWAEFTAEGTRSGGEALAVIREVKASFAEWIAKQGKSDAVVATLTTLFNNRAALQLQGQGNKDKVKGYVEAYFESLSEELAERYIKPIQAVLDSCEAVDDALADL